MKDKHKAAIEALDTIERALYQLFPHKNYATRELETIREYLQNEPLDSQEIDIETSKLENCPKCQSDYLHLESSREEQISQIWCGDCSHRVNANVPEEDIQVIWNYLALHKSGMIGKPPEGYVLVPIEPTEAMMDAGKKAENKAVNLATKVKGSGEWLPLTRLCMRKMVYKAMIEEIMSDET